MDEYNDVSDEQAQEDIAFHIDKLKRALDCPLILDGDEITVSIFFWKLLQTLWEEKECFSGKRPFGDSGWEYDVYVALIRGGFIDGSIDEWGSIEDCDEKLADKFVSELIGFIFSSRNLPAPPQACT